MIIGLILVGTVLGGAAGAGALLLGSSIWTAFLIYVAIGTASVLMLAVSVALRLDPQDHANAAEPYACSARGAAVSAIHEIESPRSAFRPRREKAAGSASAS